MTVQPTPIYVGGRNGDDNSGGTALQILSLSPGYVILTINGETIEGREACIDAIRRSPQTMVFTVRDSRDGTVWKMQTELNSPDGRFGIDLIDNPGGGASVTRVCRGYPATKCYVLERES